MKKSRYSSILSKVIKASAVFWLLSIAIFSGTVFFATNRFTATVQDTQFGNSNLFLFLILGSMGIGSLAFGLLALGIIIRIILEKKVLRFERSFKGILFFGSKLLFLLAIFPLFLLYIVSGFRELIRRFRSDGFRLTHLKPQGVKSFVVRLISIVAISLTLFPIWIGAYWFAGTTMAYQLGYIPEDITIVGTGSMYPTWPKGAKEKSPKELAKEVVGTAGFLKYPNGIVIAGNRILGHKIGRGDIITWENDATRELTSRDGGEPAGLLKRIIAVSGDILELKEGIIYLNNQPMKEPYIAKARSTFGENFLKECQKVEVPQGYVFAMGDNRKGSADSREIGFAAISDIDYVLPFASQKGILDKNWHDATNDLESSSEIKIDRTKFLELLNEKRRENGAKPLKYQTKLEKSATYRGQAILKYDDFSFEATKSGYPMEIAMSNAGYWNTYNWEVFIPGYYEAGELIGDYLERDTTETKKYWFDKRFQDIGIAEVEGTLNNCPTQIVVIHVGGYIPPNYQKDVIESWRQTVSNLNEVIPSWERVKGQSWINQDDLKRLLDLLNRERAIASNILSRMETNQWLTRDEEASIKEYDRLSTESMGLAKKLNSQ